MQHRLEANRGAREEDRMRGHRLACIWVEAPLCIRKCRQLEATLLARDGEIDRPGQLVK